MNYSILLFALSVVGVCNVDAAAQQTIARPTGIFCSCPPTNSNSSSFRSDVAAKGFVDGFLVRISWETVEPSPGVFDWSLLDGQVQQCQQAGKQIALAVVQGSGTPSWLAPMGAAMIQYTFQGQARSIAVPWDPIYMQRWQQLVAALGARYAADPVITLVHVTHASHNGFEMQLPFGEQAQYLAAGYTDAAYTQSWQTTIDSFAAAFPNDPLDCDVHPVFGSDAVAQAVVAHGSLVAPGRFGAFGGWWSVSNAQNAYPGMQTIFEGQAADTFTNVQNVGSWVTTPTRYGSNLATYEAAYQLGLDTGVRYFEVWNADLLDPGLDGFLSQVNADVHCASWYQVYPDAANPGVLQHGIDGCITPGATFELTLSGGTPGGLGVVGLGTDRGAATVPGIGLVQIAPLATIGLFQPVVLDASGSGSVVVQSPATTGFVFTTQAVVLSGTGFTISNALELR